MASANLTREKSVSLFRNVSLGLLGFIVNGIIAFFLSPYIIRSLGDDRYGMWSLVGDLVGYSSLLDLGITGAVGHFVSRYSAQCDEDQLSRLLTTSFWMLSGICLITVLSGMTLTAFVPIILNFRSLSVGEVQTSLAIMTAVIGLNFPMALYVSTLIGNRRLDISNGIDICARLLSSALTWYLLREGYGLTGIAAATLAGRLTGWTATIAWLKRAGVKLPRPGRFHAAHARDLLHYGGKTLVINIAMLVIHRTDSIVIGILLGLPYITVFSIGAVLVQYAFDACSAITRAFTPHMTYVHADGDKTLLEQLYWKGIRSVGLFVVIIAATLMVFGKPFLTLWVGPEYVTGDLTRRSDIVLLILLSGNIPRLMQHISWQLLFAMRKHTILMWFSIGEAAANLILSICLVPVLGVAGAALGTALPLLVTQGILLPRHLITHHYISSRSYFRRIFWTPLMIGAFNIVAGATLRVAVSPSTWSVLICEVVLTVVVTSVMAFCMALDGRERTTVIARLRSFAMVPEQV